jgi:hypothetical protein
MSLQSSRLKGKEATDECEIGSNISNIRNISNIHIVAKYSNCEEINA